MSKAKENEHQIWYAGSKKLYRAGSIMTVVKVISKYKFNLVEIVQR
jgi:hypothetical protein